MIRSSTRPAGAPQYSGQHDQLPRASENWRAPHRPGQELTLLVGKSGNRSLWNWKYLSTAMCISYSGCRLLSSYRPAATPTAGLRPVLPLETAPVEKKARRDFHRGGRQAATYSPQKIRLIEHTPGAGRRRRQRVQDRRPDEKRPLCGGGCPGLPRGH